MSQDILGSLMRVLVTVPKNRLGLVLDIAHKFSLSDTEGEMWELNGKKFLRKEPCWSKGKITQVMEQKPTSSIIEFISTIVVSATTSKFVAKEKFVCDTGCKAKVKISYLGGNFTEWFLSGNGKTEDPISEQKLRYHKLLQSLLDGPIITELGGEAKAETTLSELFSLMEKQGKGGHGVFFINGYANIFYVMDQNGMLRTVYVCWFDDGWNIYARPLEDMRRWKDGLQVFSRIS
ncbi:MAG: hypothetical protein AAB484_00130 [Patescibacteria group bacterium]